MADREAIRARPYDDDAEQGLILRLQEHHAKLESIREALLRQCKAASDQHPLRRRTDLTGAHK